MFQIAAYLTWAEQSRWYVHANSEAGLSFWWRDVGFQLGRLAFTLVLTTPMREAEQDG